MKKFSVYFFSTLALIACLIILAIISNYLREYIGKTFNTTPYAIYMFFSPIFVGFLFAMPRLVYLRKQPGKLSFDWVRALAIGIPTLFIGVGLILFFFSPLEGLVPNLLIIKNMEVRLFGSMLFGYGLLTSIKKVED
jgi:hypothetical protein